MSQEAYAHKSFLLIKKSMLAACKHNSQHIYLSSSIKENYTHCLSVPESHQNLKIDASFQMLVSHFDLFLFSPGCDRGQRQIHNSLRALYHTETTAIPTCILTEGL